MPTLHIIKRRGFTFDQPTSKDSNTYLSTLSKNYSAAQYYYLLSHIKAGQKSDTKIFIMPKLYILIYLLFTGTSLLAQGKIITGIVTDNKGEPIAYASVLIKGTSSGTSTDVSGRYTIRITSSKVTLVFSAIGMDSKEIIVDNSSIINVVLEKKSSELNEVVVTAVGMSTVRRLLSGSISGVSVNAINANKNIGVKTWKRSGLDENSVKLSVGDNDFIPLKAVQTAVQVDGFRARVLFDYFFYSDKPKNLRGNFKLKLPAGASPYYFAFGGTEYFNTDKNNTPFVTYSNDTFFALVNDSILSKRNNTWRNIKQAIVAPKEKASMAFNEVVRGRIDPALMEWAGADVFSCSVYPIEKNKLHRIVVGYDINLLEMDSNAVFKLILPYNKIDKKLDIDIAVAENLIHKIEPPLVGNLFAGSRMKYHKENFKEKEFEISMFANAPIFLQNNDKDKYFAVSYSPTLKQVSVSLKAQKAVFMLDVSLSSQPDKFNVWLKAIEGILKNNREEIKEFAIQCFNVDASWWRDFYSRNNENSVAEFLEWADDLSLVGATDLNLALKEAVNPTWQMNKNTKPDLLFLMSDGDASWGEADLYQLSQLIPHNTKLYGFTTGFSGTDTRILNHLSRETNGAVFSLLNEDEVEKVSKAIQNKPWQIVSTTYDGGKDLLIAGRPAYVFPGQKLLITGRGELNNHSIIKIKLKQDELIKEIDIPVTEIISSYLSNRIYGQTAVSQLEDFNFKTETAAIKYATHFNVPGQTCALLMLESKALYDRFGLDSLETKKFIDSNLVTQIIASVIEKDFQEKTLGSAKAVLLAWLNKLEKDKVLNFKADELWRSHLSTLTEKTFVIDLPRITGTNLKKVNWYNGTNDQLQQNSLDYDKLMKLINAEKKIEGNNNAFKLISSFAENNRNDITLLREVAFTLSNWNMDGKSYELLKRLMLSRPAEPPTYNQIANSLIKMNNIDLAMVYYDIAFLTEWDDRFEGFNLITAVEYYKLLNAVKLGKYKVTDTVFAQQRLEILSKFLKENGNLDVDEADLMIVITWNTDNTDVDLHVREPSGEECFYSHTKTASGGFLSNDATEGFGPEMYFLKTAPKGKYSLDLDYFSSSRVETSVKSKVLVTAYKNWGRENEERIQKIVEMKRPEQKPKKKKKVHNEDDDENDKMMKDVLVIDF